MEENALAVAEELQRRLDDTPILGEYIKAFLTEKSNDGFFLNRDYLAWYMKASKAKRKDLPGHAFSRRYGISTMLIIQVGCLWNT